MIQGLKLNKVIPVSPVSCQFQCDVRDLCSYNKEKPRHSRFSILCDGKENQKKKKPQEQHGSAANRDFSESCWHYFLKSMPVRFEGYVKQRWKESSKSSYQRKLCLHWQRGVNSVSSTSVGRQRCSINAQRLDYSNRAKPISKKPSQKEVTSAAYGFFAATMQTAIRQQEKEQCCRL